MSDHDHACALAVQCIAAARAAREVPCVRERREPLIIVPAAAVNQLSAVRDAAMNAERVLGDILGELHALQQDAGADAVELAFAHTSSAGPATVEMIVEAVKAHLKAGGAPEPLCAWCGDVADGSTAKCSFCHKPLCHDCAPLASIGVPPGGDTECFYCRDCEEKRGRGELPIFPSATA